MKPYLYVVQHSVSIYISVQPIGRQMQLADSAATIQMDCLDAFLQMGKNYIGRMYVFSIGHSSA